MFDKAFFSDGSSSIVHQQLVAVDAAAAVVCFPFLHDLDLATQAGSTDGAAPLA